MDDFENKVKKNHNRNKKYIKEFEKWLRDKCFVKNRIQKHLFNATLYIDDYLNYHFITKAEDGIEDVNYFFEYWFIEKWLWATRNSLKETAASIKKFY